MDYGDFATSHAWVAGMKLYWRVKINGKWTWRPARTRIEFKAEEDENFRWIEKVVVVLEE
jgi:hypothetical protein